MHNELCSREVARYLLTPRRISQRSTDAVRDNRRGVQGSSASRTSMACSFSAAMMSRNFSSPSPGGPPRMTKPSSASASINAACSSHCSGLSHGKSGVPVLSPFSENCVVGRGPPRHEHLLPFSLAACDLSFQRLLHSGCALLDKFMDDCGDLIGQQVGDPDEPTVVFPLCKDLH